MKAKAILIKKDRDILFYIVVILGILMGVYLVQQKAYFRSEADYPMEVNTLK